MRAHSISKLLVQNEIGTIIIPIELYVVLLQEAWGQRSPLFGPLMDLQFKFGKESLAENRRPDPFDLIVDEIGPFFFRS